MRPITWLGAVSALGLLGAAAACATAENGVAEPPETDVKVPVDVPSDAGAAVDASDASVDAGPCSSAGLCIVPAPIDGLVNVTSISGSGPTDVWAVGSNRTVLHYDGSAWDKTVIVDEKIASVTMRAVWVGGPADVWIADGLYIRHSTGWKANATEWTTWMGATGDMNGLPMAISGVAGRVFIGRQVSGAFAPPPPIVTCTGMDAAGPIEREDVTDLALDRDDDPYKWGISSGVWSISTIRPDEAWVAKFASPRVARIYRATADGGEDAGASWVVEEHDTHSSKNILGVWGDEQAVWLVGDSGTVRRMTRERISTRLFEAVPAPATATLRGIYGLSANDVWAVGDDATVIHWNGEVWSRLATPFDTAREKPTLISVWGSGPNDVWIGGNGVMLHFEGKTP